MYLKEECMYDNIRMMSLLNALETMEVTGTLVIWIGERIPRIDKLLELCVPKSRCFIRL